MFQTQNEAASTVFLEFGSVYKKSLSEKDTDLIRQIKKTNAQRYLSRFSLQLLFKNAVNQSPKKYISDMKLEKSCQMLRENKYTISEISLKLGYSSIHCFSNAFNQ